ncbi:uncharacterized protein LOC109612849 [Musca domestica]|uniref:Uncharacterized protein LOC109612849 n=1 Tax=Musca domestica TaxID=7370 RepID=A0A9J7DH31_MUSDO|nr:uncharacterized protein LOC109612849 [Musca domestica]
MTRIVEGQKPVNKDKVQVTVNTTQLEDNDEMVRCWHRQFSNLAEHLQQWIEKNSQPKRYNFPRPCIRREPCRWAKRGPMARKDWVRFYNWAAKNATPKPPYQPKIRTKDKEKEKKTEPKEPIPLEELMEHAEKLASPRMRRQKYEYPIPPDYPYAPQIHPKKPAKKDRGRPFKTPEVPPDFQHIELEIDFWSQLRFPTRSSTALYNPTENILKLAQPKVIPPLKQHCPIPEKPVEYVAPRRRMTYRQWREHKRRLEYLAKPIYRPVTDYYYF